MHPHASRPFVAVLLLSIASLGMLTGCSDTSSSRPEVLTTRDCSSESLRQAVDSFRIQPSDATRRAVINEMAALDEHIVSLMDHAEIAEGKAKAQLLCDAEAMRLARKFNIQRFNAPIEKQPEIAVSKAEKAEVEEVPKAVAVAAAPVREMPVRRAIPVNDPVTVATLAVGSNASAEIPVRRAIPVNFSIPNSSRTAVVVQSANNRRITIWHPARYSSELARR